MTKVDIISGFLGAGKTTLIKKLLEDGLNKEKVVLIENEYGEVGIDGGFLKDAGIQITEMNSGCICCTLVGDFVTSIQQIMNDYAPDRIIIEPSGVGKLSDVMAAVIEMEKDNDLKLDSLVTVVNTLKFRKQQKAFGEFFSNQIEHATTVILSRSQDADDEALDSCTKMIQEKNPKAAVITTPWDQISGEKILSVMEGRDNLEAKTLAMHNHEHDQAEHAEHHHHEHGHHDHEDHHGDVQPSKSADADGAAQSMQSTPASGAPLHTGCDHEHGHCCHDHEHHHHDNEDHSHCDHEHGHCEHDHHHDHDHHHHHGHHHADEIFDTWGRETAKKIDRTVIEKALAAFSKDDGRFGNILRAKGMVNSPEGWIYFDYVEGEFETRRGDPDYTGRLVVIGTDLDEHEIEKAFGL